MKGFSSTLIGSRLAWCRLQRIQANTKEEADKFLAEEEGLLDAMCGRDRSEIYSQNRDPIVKSYEIGLHDGQVLMGLQRWGNTRQTISHKGEGRIASIPGNQRSA